MSNPRQHGGKAESLQKSIDQIKIDMETANEIMDMTPDPEEKEQMRKNIKKQSQHADLMREDMRNENQYIHNNL